MTWLLLAFEIAIIAWAYSVKLTEPDMILSPLMNAATIMEAKRPWTQWILKPLLTCTYCVAGQMAMWSLLLIGVFHLDFVRTFIDALFFPSITLVIVQCLIKLLHD